MTVTTRITADLTRPEPGHRLQLSVVCADLKVSVTDIAAATGLPRTAAYGLLTNDFPARANAQDRQLLREQVEALVAGRGATALQIATLWHARVGKGRRKAEALAAVAHMPAHDAAELETQPKEEDMLLPKQALSPLARRHFKLFTNPFDGEVVTDDQMFNGADVRYVREAAWQCCQTGSFVAIVGESGAGKTTVLLDLEERIARQAGQVTVIKPSVLGMEQLERNGSVLRSADILHAIITVLAPQRTMPQTLQARTVAAAKLLTASAQLGNKHLLVIEEAHTMPSPVLKHLKRLHEMRNGRQPLLSILLLAQPELKTRLADGLRDGSLREVAQRCEVVELLPLTANDLRDYLACRAAAAGVPTLDGLVDAGGVAALCDRLTLRRPGAKHAISLCYPLAVNNLMTLALNCAADIGVPVVTADVVKTL